MCISKEINSQLKQAFELRQMFCFELKNDFKELLELLLEFVVFEVNIIKPHTSS